MTYTIDYYSDAVRLDIDALPHTLRARYAGMTARMVEHGPTSASRTPRHSVTVSSSYGLQAPRESRGCSFAH